MAPPSRPRTSTEDSIIKTHTPTDGNVTVEATASALVAASTNAYRNIDIRCVTKSVRIGLGVTPTATKGQLVQAGESFTFSTDLAVNAIRAGADDATVIVNVYSF